MPLSIDNKLSQFISTVEANIDSNGELILPVATTSQQGIIQITDSNGAVAGINDTDAMTPKKTLLSIQANTTPTPDASTSVKGKIQITDSNGVVVGSDDLKAVTPNKLKVWGNNKTASEKETRLSVITDKFVTPANLKWVQTTLDNMSLSNLADAHANNLPAYALVNGLLDRFVNNSGIDTVGSTNLNIDTVTHCLTNITTPSTSYANSGGTGNRTASITVTTNVTWDSGSNSNLVNGDLTSNSTAAVDTPGTGATAFSPGTTFIRFDFGNGTKKYIDEIKVYQDSVTPNQGLWNIQGSDDASSWTTYGSYTWNATTVTGSCTGVPSVGHRYWQVTPNASGVWSNSWLKEFEFKIAAGAASVTEFTVLSNAYTAGYIPDVVRVLILSEPVDSVTVNTDLLVSGSRNGGTTYTQATLINIGTYASKNILVAFIDLSGQSSGTSMKWKIQTANSKRQKVHGLTLFW